ncbi:MAG: ribonuclease E/G, partial [Gammaproteobacteria bacterium]|nr:ribonuclease E/G [Gammaproteobacteria bacterium]
DLGGLVVIDFIDMGPSRNQREVENRLREALKVDRARVQIGRISRFGLLEMSRQRLRPSLGESSQQVCPRCSGHGTIRGVESISLAILRVIEEEAMKDKTGRVVAQVPVEVATFLLNEKRDMLSDIEQRHKVQALLVPNTELETPHYEVQRLREDDLSPDDRRHSYQMVTRIEENSGVTPSPKETTAAAEQPAVKSVAPATPRPVSTAPEKPGLFIQIWKALFGKAEEQPEAKPRKQSTQQRKRKPQQHRSKSNAGTGRRGENKQNRQSQDRPARTESTARQGDSSTKERPAQRRKPRSNAPQTDETNIDNKQQQSSDDASGNRRGRRGGRRRRKSPNEAEGQQQKTQETNTANTEAAPAPANERKPETPRSQPGRDNRAQSNAQATSQQAVAEKSNPEPVRTQQVPQQQESKQEASQDKSGSLNQVETKPVATEKKPEPVAETTVRAKEPEQAKPINQSTNTETKPAATAPVSTPAAEKPARQTQSEDAKLTQVFTRPAETGKSETETTTSNAAKKDSRADVE